MGGRWGKAGLSGTRTQNQAHSLPGIFHVLPADCLPLLNGARVRGLLGRETVNDNLSPREQNEADVTSKLKEQCGNLIENKGQAISGTESGGNVK